MKRSPDGFTKKAFRVFKRRQFGWMCEEIDDFLEDSFYIPIPMDVLDSFRNALEDIEYYISTESWGH